jgi:ribonuclease PH
MPLRVDARAPLELRPLTIEGDYLDGGPGKVLVRAGRTAVLCSATLIDEVPAWMAGKGVGWVTAEYGMLPGSTSPRKPRDRMKVDGRTTEIQRLVGRSLRAVVDFKRLGERQLTIDCDVLEADGGTRTASITGAYVAMAGALQAYPEFSAPDAWPLSSSVAAVSVGIVDGRVLLDLNYREDSRADVDMNVVMTGAGEFIEVQGTGERTTFTFDQLQSLLDAARQGIQQLTELQQRALG